MAISEDRQDTQSNERKVDHDDLSQQWQITTLESQFGRGLDDAKWERDNIPFFGFRCLIMILIFPLTVLSHRAIIFLALKHLGGRSQGFAFGNSK
jgi:hypothetical protein